MKPKIQVARAGKTMVVVSLCLVLWLCSSPNQPAAPTPADEKSSTESQPAPPKPAKETWANLKTVDIAVDAPVDAQAELTRNFYFIFDGSGSMSEKTNDNCGGDRQFKSKIDGARWAIETFIDKVPQSVNLGLYVFDKRGKREVVPLGATNRQAFLGEINRVHVGGGTPLAKAILFGTDRLVDQYRTQLGYGEFRLVVITDGKAGDIPKAAVYAARRGIPIYTIGLCVGERHPLRRYSVSYRAADSFEDLAKGLQDTLAELPNYDATTFN